MGEPVPVAPASGLTAGEAASRLGRFGPNELPPPPRDRLPGRVLRHVREPMALLLIIAAAVAGLALGERLQAVAILAIVTLNVAIGIVQEGKATRALDALRQMEMPTARVRREGVAKVIPAREIVPGDIVLLGAGDRAPADARVVSAKGLEIDESLLTGESLPVAKESDGSLAFAGTFVTRGSAVAEAVATGSRTELGRIAERLAAPETPTPLQTQLGALTARLGTIAVVIAAGVFGLTLLRTGFGDGGLERAFLSAVALAVAAVPEGLAAVVTVALALGVRRMAAERAIVRRLPAVETLGSTTVILTDKTGTLTENRMQVDSVALMGQPLVPFPELGPEVADLVTEVAVLCNDATLEPRNGDPLEIALLEVVDPGRIRELRLAHPRIDEVPFDSDRKRMATVNGIPGGVLLLVKGAPETVVERAVEGLPADGAGVPLTDVDRRALLETATEMADGGARVLALARRVLPDRPGRVEEAERELTFVALVGLRDPVRQEARAAVKEAQAAGVRIVMVTGDHPGTASAVAQRTGLAKPGSPVIVGDDLRDGGLPDDPIAVPVYARIDPVQKLALVEALQDDGHVVAVTGDGVNDAPAMKRADIGVAMGRTGSDVAREAADMVVTDDNLATIVTAVREGRGIYDNIRKVVDYLVAGNLSEIAVVVGTLMLFPALGVPLLPFQLLWVNLLTDGLPAIALGVDPVDPGLMSRPPRSRDERILGGRKAGILLTRGLIIATAAVGSLAAVRFAFDESWVHARAVMFTVLVIAHVLYAFAARLPTRGLNRMLLMAVVGGLALQALVVLWPAAHPVFGTTFLTLRDWAIVALAATVPVAVMWAWSFLGRKGEERAKVPRESGPVALNGESGDS